MARGDGRLTHDLLPGEKGPQDACGVFGVWAPGEEVAKLTYFGLYALQHRGQESAGIATSNGEQILVYKDMGLVSQVFDDVALSSLTGHIALGHTRYSTTGASTWQNAQPTLGPTASGTVALGHNGNLTNTSELVELVEERYGPRMRHDLADGCATDTTVITALLSGDPDHTLEATALEVLPRLRGAFSLVFMDEHALYGARDPQGIRPLVIGRLERGWVIASETAALDIVGASFVREVEPGELVTIDADGLRTERFAPADRKGCVFEYVYLARPDTTIVGRSLHAARVAMGRTLAQEAPVEADLVIPVPESGTPAAIGYATESGIPFGQGLTKNAYVGRTFIQPSQTIRQLGIRLKLNPLREVIRGKRLVVVDDSIVRGNTQRALVRMLREAGAAEVHVRISSPPVKWPCFYGIDFPTRAELIANGLSPDEIGASLGADSLAYISLEGMIEATEQPASKLCSACFTGTYPVELTDQERLAHRKDLGLEQDELPLGPPEDKLLSLVPATGGASALDQP
ncbi:amidophosphoribosyltransferase [Beutenbergia cavernae DSM 12333]|uniref:Amidophosphoribosyltransferase n=1 Tax=Beutenbergia cavernae (strain ATCC BAA-8 / DSM 12333 / CCUG 43141 / JCM 11478 / NBRC 16432 / NCIMB 13614 / HKI 0122) TaxID=471853 RepID=C5C2R4_BEUC1|nr:amidophosphoribosyltransferase [Beutenbergia cavernae]ACQ81758.1 amidophosphoribosyltransferase [Beutenbergia cavernae DSM 12333]